MKLLNIGCGGVRPPAPWINLDNLREQLLPGTPERANLDAEPNYVEHDISIGALPFGENEFDGVMCSHVLEHFDCHAAVSVIAACHTVLKPGGVFFASVPNAEYFLMVHDRDCRGNAEELFGEPICPAEPWHKSFFDYALFFHQHKQVLDRHSLWCLLLRGGFEMIYNIVNPCMPEGIYRSTQPVRDAMKALRNRAKFSAELVGVKFPAVGR